MSEPKLLNCPLCGVGDRFEHVGPGRFLHRRGMAPAALKSCLLDGVVASHEEWVRLGSMSRLATLRREVEAVAARLIAPINLDDAEDSFLAQREIMEECSTRLTDALREPKE